MVGARGKSSFVSDVLREPTLHFALGALALFAANAAVRAGGPGDVIVIERGRVDARVARIEATLGVALTDEERAQVEADYVETQILAREARGLGLDDDPQVHDLLAQKMLDILSADVIRPSDAELDAYYRANSAHYNVPATVTVAELVVATPGPLPDRVREQLLSGAEPEKLAGSGLVQTGELADITRADLARIFGEETAARIMESPAGAWVGPHPSVRGQHWFRVMQRTDAWTPTLSSVLERVRLDWIAEHEQKRLAERVAELRARHTVVFTALGPAR